MSETFDGAATNPGSGGETLAGDRFTQGEDSLFLPAAYLVFGPADGPYSRVEAATGLPVRVMDGAGDPVGRFAPTEYTEGDTDATPTGMAVLWRKGTGNAMLCVSNANPLPVQFGSPLGVIVANTEPLTVTGLIDVQQGGPEWNTANVAGSASSVTLLAGNANRRLAVIYNDSSANLYVKLGHAASTTSFSYKLGPGDTLEVTHYTGRIDGVWASATGDARVTEAWS